MRQDLVIVARDNGKVLVKRPEAPTAFPIYLNEWTIAQLLDGERTYASVATGAARMGVTATPELVASFVRELNGYGFLSTERAAPRNRSPLRAGLEAAKSDEERQLIMAALAVDDGTSDSAVAEYLDAILQVNPENDDVREAMEEYQNRRAPIAESARTYIGPSPATHPVRRDTMRADLPPTGLERELEPESEARQPPAPSGGRPMLGIVIGLAVAAVTAVLGYVIWSNRQLQVQLATLQTQPAVVPQAQPQSNTPSEPTTAAVLARLDFEAASRESIRATEAGVWAEALVAVGAEVEAGAVVGTTMSAKDYQVYARARRRYARVESSARGDDVYRYFLAQARADFEGATRSLARYRVTAGQAGRVTALPVKVGAAVSAETVVAELASRDKLSTSLDATLLPFPPSEAVCQVDAAASCSVLVSTAGSAIIELEDPAHAIPPDRPVTVKISRRGAR